MSQNSVPSGYGPVRSSTGITESESKENSFDGVTGLTSNPTVNVGEGTISLSHSNSANLLNNNTSSSNSNSNNNNNSSSTNSNNNNNDSSTTTTTTTTTPDNNSSITSTNTNPNNNETTQIDMIRRIIRVASRFPLAMHIISQAYDKKIFDNGGLLGPYEKIAFDNMQNLKDKLFKNYKAEKCDEDNFLDILEKFRNNKRDDDEDHNGNNKNMSKLTSSMRGYINHPLFKESV